jgi:hypothetical protein
MDDEFMGMSNKKARFGLFMLMAKHAVYLPDLGSFFRYLSDFYLLTGSAMKLELQESDEWVRLTLKTNKSSHYSGLNLHFRNRGILQNTSSCIHAQLALIKHLTPLCLNAVSCLFP